ncbi:MAG: 2-alkenal reductase [Chloroflexota bacterium]
MNKHLWLWLIVLVLLAVGCAALGLQATAPVQGITPAASTSALTAATEAEVTSGTPVAQAPTQVAPPVATPTATLLQVRTTTSGLSQTLTDVEALLVDIYKRVSPAVVYIETDNGSGSGFVYDKEGHIVTNNHVIQDANRIEVVFANRKRAEAEVVGSDVDADIAVLKVDVPADELVVADLGDSDAVQVGQFAIAIGNPFGLQNTMTVGIVSGLGRTLQSDRVAPGGSGGRYSNPNVIQTDAAINPGNSGGPLLDSQGRVIGINTAIRSTAQGVTGQPVNTGVGFAVPINTVKRIIPALIRDGHYTYPWLGISAAGELDLETQRALGLPQSTGVYVTEVTPGGPADKAGIRAGTRNVGLGQLRAGGDLIIAIDGHEVRDFADLVGYLVSQTEVGQTVTLTIIRNGRQMDVQVTLGARP